MAKRAEALGQLKSLGVEDLKLAERLNQLGYRPAKVLKAGDRPDELPKHFISQDDPLGLLLQKSQTICKVYSIELTSDPRLCKKHRKVLRNLQKLAIRHVVDHLQLQKVRNHPTSRVVLVAVGVLQVLKVPCPVHNRVQKSRGHVQFLLPVGHLNPASQVQIEAPAGAVVVAVVIPEARTHHDRRSAIRRPAGRVLPRQLQFFAQSSTPNQRGECLSFNSLR